ncbi:MAG: putative integral rane protein, partial [Verrucomicrobiales bacterium]|nr:putative integral rane protein [Verrucomicrobiales bacterium]
VALIASAGCLYLFGSLDDQPGSLALAMTVVVGLPAALGASAGRLLLQSGSKSNPPKKLS